MSGDEFEGLTPTQASNRSRANRYLAELEPACPVKPRLRCVGGVYLHPGRCIWCKRPMAEPLTAGAPPLTWYELGAEELEAWRDELRTTYAQCVEGNRKAPRFADRLVDAIGEIERLRARLDKGIAICSGCRLPLTRDVGANVTLWECWNPTCARSVPRCFGCGRREEPSALDSSVCACCLYCGGESECASGCEREHQ